MTKLHYDISLDDLPRVLESISLLSPIIKVVLKLSAQRSEMIKLAIIVTNLSSEHKGWIEENSFGCLVD